jgi:hypothetical protein
MAERSAITVRVLQTNGIGTAILTSALPAGIDGQIIVASGRDTFGDGGGGLLVFDASSSATPDNATVWQVGALPGRWERVFSGELNARWYGAKGDGVTDDADAIQDCIDHAVNNGLGSVFIPDGVYLVSGCLHLSKSGSLSSVLLRGAGPKYTESSAFCGTMIKASHSNQPCINVQGGRGTKIRDLTIKGALYNWISSRSLGAFDNTTYSDTASSDWDDPSLASTADSRYAPYAGICIDGWAGSEPATHYPTTRMAYGIQGYSSDTLIENVYIIGFTAGLANQPGDSDGNGDFTVLRSVNMSQCKWGVSVGNTQSRNLSLTDCQMGQVYKLLVNNKHGRQTGKFCSTINNLSAAQFIAVFEFNSLSIAGPIRFNSFYGEAMWRIGDFAASSSSETGITFSSCIFSLGSQTEARGIPTTVLGGTPAQVSCVSFDNCSITHYPSVLGFAHDVAFDGSMVLGSTRETNSSKEYLARLHNATCDGVIFPRLATRSRQRIHFTAHTITTHVPLGPVMAQDGMYATTSRPYCIPAWVNEVGTTSGQYRDSARIPRPVIAVAKSGLTIALTQDASKRGELAITFTSLSDADAANRGMNPGDICWDDATGTVFAIRAREQVAGVGDSRKLTCEIQNNYRLSGGTYACIDSFSTSSGNLYFMPCGVYTPTYPTIADITSASPTLAAVGRDDGFGGFTTADVIVDDRVLIDAHGDRWVADANNKITAVDAGALTITLAGNAVRSLSRKRIPFFLRQPPANEASR